MLNSPVMQRLALARRALLIATPFVVLGALYVAGKNQFLGFLIVAAFFGIALRFAKIQEKAEALETSAAASNAGMETEPA